MLQEIRNNEMSEQEVGRRAVCDGTGRMNTEQDREERHQKKIAFWNGMIVGMSSALVIVCAVCLVLYISRYAAQNGWGQNAGSGPAIEENDREQNGSSTELYAGSVVDSELIEKMKLIETLIKQNYYRNEDIGAEEMETGIYDGMISSLGDIYADYYTAEELEKLMLDTEGIYFGIGAGITTDTVSTYPKISKVYAGTPSEEAGLRENDIIYEVDHEDVYGLALTEVVSRIKGEEGTWVNLTIIREGETDYLSIDVQRRQVSIPTVETRMLDEEIAYIQIVEFDTITIEQFSQALEKSRQSGMKGLILDLRSNPGGSLAAVVEIAREILPEGMIVYTEDKYGKRQEYTCDGSKQLEVPLVVLINENSASASEIMAGAVKDYGIGTLVGMTTYGKGIVQSIAPLSDGSAVKLTISSYYTPKGNDIHGIGVEPDVECVFDGEAYYGDPARPDNQLDKAAEVLRELMEAKK